MIGLLVSLSVYPLLPVLKLTSLILYYRFQMGVVICVMSEIKVHKIRKKTLQKERDRKKIVQFT